MNKKSLRILGLDISISEAEISTGTKRGNGRKLKKFGGLKVKPSEKNESGVS